MNNPYDSNEKKLQRAAGFIKAGQKKEARQLLRDILAVDKNNLVALELLAYASLNIQEETYCLNRILSLRSDHPWAKQRLAEISALPPTVQASAASKGLTPVSTESKQKARSSLPNHKDPPRRKRRDWVPILIGFAIVVGILAQGLILLRFGLQPTGSSAQLTKTAAAGKSALCREIITRALEASGSYCDQFDSNSICYGNETLLAELIPEASQRFAERGDIIGIDYLQRLSVSPLNLEAQEWGIAILKVMANLPRSLPGETVTLMVFGNTTFDNAGQNLETFYFSSGAGEIVCEEVPFDGIMISMPDGTGIQFMVNNAELILMGNASLSAVRNGDMEVRLFSGSGQITSLGQTQSFGAGEQVSIQLGGTSGMEAVSLPSTPVPLSPDDLVLSCTLTGEYCDETDIQPISDEDIEKTLEAGFQFTPTLQPTPSLTHTPSMSLTLTTTITPSISSTSTKTITPTRTGTRTLTPTTALTPLRTFTKTRTPTASYTPLHTYTATRTPIISLTPSFTDIPSPTFTDTPTPTFTDTPTLPTMTFTPSSTQTPTDTPAGPVACVPSEIYYGLIEFDTDQLDVDIRNDFGSAIRISLLHFDWLDAGPTKLDHIEFKGVDIWDHPGDLVDESPPSDFAVSGSEFDWDSSGGARTMSAGSTETLMFDFDPNVDLPDGSYTLRVTFDGSANCYIETVITK